MTHPYKRLAALLPLALAALLAACTLTSSGEQARQATADALTQTAQAGEQTGTPPAGDQSADTPQLSDTPVPETPTITPTFTSSVPLASVSVDTNCRGGPAIYYDRLGGVEVGQQVEIVGQAPGGYDYVVVKLPGPPEVICWLWLEYATINGDLSGLPIFPVPPTPTPTATPTPALPEAPSGLTVADQSCEVHIHAGPQFHLHLTFVKLTWNDNADNEDGYRVYRDGDLIATLPAGTTMYTDGEPDDTSHTYAVEAYNADGASAQATIGAGCL